MSTIDTLWSFLIPGFFTTIAIETPVLLFCLSKRHPLQQKLFAGIGLTAFTYPFVVLIFPILIWEPFGRPVYLAVAEFFAPLTECLLFYWFWIRLKNIEEATLPLLNRSNVRDFLSIILANLCSFIPFEILQIMGISIF